MFYRIQSEQLEWKKLLALFCIVSQYVISTGTISNTSIYQPQSVTVA